MNVRLTSTLICTLCQGQKQGRVVAMRRRFTFVLFTVLMTLLTKS